MHINQWKIYLENSTLKYYVTQQSGIIFLIIGTVTFTCSGLIGGHTVTGCSCHTNCRTPFQSGGWIPKKDKSLHWNLLYNFSNGRATSSSASIGNNSQSTSVSFLCSVLTSVLCLCFLSIHNTHQKPNFQTRWKPSAFYNYYSQHDGEPRASICRTH